MEVRTIEPIVRQRDKAMAVRNVRPVEVLLVEDNPGDIILVEESFREGGMTVNLTVVGDGPEAVLYIKREEPYLRAPRPDIVILDLRVPRIDGHQILRTLREMNEFKQVPVAILSSSNMAEDIRKSYDLGATCYITKPFGFNNFMEAVKSLEHFWFKLATLP